MKKSYLTAAFQKTAKKFPEQAEVLNAAFDTRLSGVFRDETRGCAGKHRQHALHKNTPKKAE